MKLIFDFGYLGILFMRSNRKTFDKAVSRNLQAQLNSYENTPIYCTVEHFLHSIKNKDLTYQEVTTLVLSTIRIKKL